MAIAESLSKLFAVILSLSYVTGAIVIISSGRQLGWHDLSLVDFGLVATGLVFVVINAIGMLGLVGWSLLLRERWDGTFLFTGSASFRRASTAAAVLQSLAIVAASLLFYVGVLYGAKWLVGALFDPIRPRQGPNLVLWWAAIDFAAAMVLAFAIPRFAFARRGAAFVAFGFVLAVLAMILFGRSLYRAIPAELGGGAPQSVQLLLERDKASLLKLVGIGFTEPAKGQAGVDAGGKDLLLSDYVTLFVVGADRYTFCISGCDSLDPLLLTVKQDDVAGFLR